jgi:hypothetical protein
MQRVWWQEENERVWRELELGQEEWEQEAGSQADSGVPIRRT